MGRGAIAFATVAALLMGGGSAAAAGPRQSGSFGFTTTTPGAVTGNRLNVDFVNPDNPELKPYAAARMVVHIPPGTVTDTRALPQCKATDAEIYLQGWDACPKPTQIGSGLAVTANGDGTTSNTPLRHFNNQDEVVGIGQNEQIPVLRTIDRTELDGSTSTSDFPVFPGVPPPEPYTPVKHLEIAFPPYEKGGKAYTRTPPACPPEGYWTFVVDFTYRDGVTESIESHSPCG